MGGTRRELVKRLGVEIRALTAAADLLQSGMAQHADLNRTDLRALDAIARGSGVTAGRLATELHLTTGAVTGVLDRLERSGHVRRASDAADRRRVVVEPTETAVATAGRLVDGVRRDMARLAASYSEAELERFLEFLAAIRGSVEERARELAGPPEN